MRYPVGKSGNSLDSAWYNAQPFGNQTSYGYHEGDDFNLKTGGDSDLGQPLYAVADGKIAYYHNASHPTSGFGRHMVLECDTSRGKRWYHYAHCQEITAGVKEVKEGDVIGKLGKSGTVYAHLHFAVFKVDPMTLSNGIDSIAKTQTQLNSNWEKFEILQGGSMPDDDARLSRDHYWNVLREISLILGNEIKQESDVDRLPAEVLFIRDGKHMLEIDKKYLEEKNRELADALKECEAQPPVALKEPPVVSGRVENGLDIHVPQPDGTIWVWNYKKE